MYQAIRIDANGMFVEPIVLDDGQILTETFTDADGNVTVQPRADIISVPVPEGFHHPKWDGEQWIEGKDDADLLAIAKAEKLLELAAARDAAIQTNFTSGTMVYGYNEVDQKNYRGQALGLLLDDTITAIAFMTKSNGMVNHTRDQFIQVCKDAKTHEETLWTQWFTRESQVNAATTVNDVKAIVW